MSALLVEALLMLHGSFLISAKPVVDQFFFLGEIFHNISEDFGSGFFLDQ